MRRKEKKYSTTIFDYSNVHQVTARTGEAAAAYVLDTISI
jgi:hypothetical protein